MGPALIGPYQPIDCALKSAWMSTIRPGRSLSGRRPRPAARAASVALTARPLMAGSPAAAYQERAANCRCALASRSDSRRARDPTRPASAALARRRAWRGSITSRSQIAASSILVNAAAAAMASPAATLRFRSTMGSITTTPFRAGAGAATGSSIHSRSLTRGCQARPRRMEPMSMRAKMSTPAVMTIQLAIENLCSAIQIPTPPNISPISVLTIWSAPQTADEVSSRAFGFVTLMTPSTQAVTRAIQRNTSTAFGIDLLTGGTNVAATMPVKRAIENWSRSGTSTPKRTRPRGGVLGRDQSPSRP